MKQLPILEFTILSDRRYSCAISWKFSIRCWAAGWNDIDSSMIVFGIGFAQVPVMHVPIERLYDFVLEESNLTGEEQSHLIRCSFCIEWLDACVTEKVSLLRSARAV